MGIQFSISQRIFFLLLTCVTFLALLLGSSRHILALPLAVFDDAHFFNQAVNVIQGRWLGEYNHLTLTKGPFYPIFLAANYTLGMPLLISQQVIYCLSGLTLIYSLYYFYKNQFLMLLIYVLYIFHPHFFFIDRVLREGIYVSLTTFVIAGSILMMASLAGKVTNSRQQFLYTLFLGLSFATFWLTREEGVWLIPSIVFLLSGGLISQWRVLRRPVIFIRTIRPLFISTLVAMILISGVGIINYLNYGVFLARSEIQSTEFRAAYGALTRVKSVNWHPHLPVPKDVRQKLYRESSLFHSLMPILDNPDLENAWKEHGCEFSPSTCGDYTGGWFMWALRDAVALSGQSQTASEALAFYRELAIQVNNLCDSHQLECLPPRKGTRPPLRLVTIRQIPETMLHAFRLVFGLDGLDLEKVTQRRSRAASLEQVRLFTELTRTPATPTIELYVGSELVSTTILNLAPTTSSVVPEMPGITANTWKLKFANWLNLVIYQRIFYLLGILAIISYLVKFPLLVFGALPWTKYYIIVTSLLLAIIARILLVSLIELTSFSGLKFYYLSPCLPLATVFTLLILVDLPSSWNHLSLKLGNSLSSTRVGG
jgi:hypothetical protein